MNPLMKPMFGMSTPSGGYNFNEFIKIFRMLKNGNAEKIAQDLMMKNPQFKEFIQANQGKDPLQVALDHGIDLKEIMGQLK